MGDMADMMLDGTMCCNCGELLGDGDEGSGFPESCGCDAEVPADV